MKIYSTGTPVVSANIVTVNDAGESTTTTINKGDTLTDIVRVVPACVACGRRCPKMEDETIASATVVNFTYANAPAQYGAKTIFDGVPVYVNEPANMCDVFTRTVIKDIVVEVPAEGEDADPETMIIPVSSIKAIGSVTAAADDSADTETTP